MDSKKKIACLLVSGILLIFSLSAKTEKPVFFTDLFWSGSWEGEKNVSNRIDLEFGFPRAGLILRTQLVDRRPVPFSESSSPPLIAFGTGLYHTGTGSRFLYGNIDETGLAARLKNIWARANLFPISHVPSAADLSTVPSGTKLPGFFLYLGSPRWGPLRLFSSLYLEHDFDRAYNAGIDFYFSKKTWLKIEGFCTEQHLPEREQSSWFSETRWLPERRSRLYAGSANFGSPFLGIAADAAFSETFAAGNGSYGDFSFRLGNKPWRFQAALDGVSGAFTDRNGSALAEGIRMGLQFEAWGKRGSYFKMITSGSGPGFDEALSKSAMSLAYYFAAAGESFFSLSQFHFTMDRKMPGSGDHESSAKISAGIYIGPVFSSTSFSISGNDDENLKPFPRFGDFMAWDLLSLSEELQYRYRIFLFKAKLIYTIEEKSKTGKTPSCAMSFYSSAHWGWGRLSGSLYFDQFPDKWYFTINWQCKKKITWYEPA